MELEDFVSQNAPGEGRVLRDEIIQFHVYPKPGGSGLLFIDIL